MTSATNNNGACAVRLRCPSCEQGFASYLKEPFQLTCLACGFAIPEVNGILRALTPESKTQYEQFVHDYEVVRARERWGSQTPDYYLALPFNDLTNEHNWIWRIRARTLRYVENHLLPKIESPQFSSCRILDIGAGNGWLSCRLAERGHHV